MLKELIVGVVAVVVNKHWNVTFEGCNPIFHLRDGLELNPNKPSRKCLKTSSKHVDGQYLKPKEKSSTNISKKCNYKKLFTLKDCQKLFRDSPE